MSRLLIAVFDQPIVNPLPEREDVASPGRIQTQLGCEQPQEFVQIEPQQADIRNLISEAAHVAC